MCLNLCQVNTLKLAQQKLLTLQQYAKSLSITKKKNKKKIFRGEWLSGLRCHTKNQKDPSSDQTKHLLGFGNKPPFNTPKELWVTVDMT